MFKHQTSKTGVSGVFIYCMCVTLVTNMAFWPCSQAHHGESRLMLKPVGLLHLFFVSNLFSSKLSLCSVIVLSNIYCLFFNITGCVDTLLFFLTNLLNQSWTLKEICWGPIRIVRFSGCCSKAFKEVTIGLLYYYYINCQHINETLTIPYTVGQAIIRKLGLNSVYIVLDCTVNCK